MRTLLLFVLALVQPAAMAHEAKPNIIVILIDDMGWGDFSCFGNMDAATPHVDRLAAEGLRFEQFYVNSPICSPSRCALMSGQYPQRLRITSYLNNRADNNRRGVAQWLDPMTPTLAGALKRHGYATGHFGKWHLGGQRDVDDAPPISDYGFDESLTNFEGMGSKLLPLTMKPSDAAPGKIWADAERLGGPVTWMPRSEITSGYVDGAVKLIDQSTMSGNPFYINLWPDDVHAPYWPPVESWGDGSPKQLYRAVLEAMDRQLGVLFDHIRSSESLRDNTLILICSDNGRHNVAGSAGPFRGTKATLYEGGIRSPLVVWCPGLMAKEAVGSVNTTSVFAAFDLLPSLLAIAGASSITGLDGENVASILAGSSSSSRTTPLFWRRPPDRKTAYDSGPLPDLAVRDGHWKLLCDYDGNKPELYDLQSDRGETTNVADQEQDITARLTKSVLEWNAAIPQDRGEELGVESSRPAPKKQGAKKNGG